jgi:hypothetical protein
MTKKEFENLKPGTLIQSKEDNKWAFIVQQNFGDRVTATRTIEIRDPDDWELINPENSEVVTFLKTVHDGALKEAAHKLNEKFRGQPWFSTIGIGVIKGEQTLYVYTALRKHPKELSEFEGYPVVYKYFGKIAPLGGI